MRLQVIVWRIHRERVGMLSTLPFSQSAEQQKTWEILTMCSYVKTATNYQLKESLTVNQEHFSKSCVMMGRCKVSLTVAIKICSSRPSDPNTFLCFTTSPRLPADIRTPMGKRSQVTLGCVHKLFVWLLMEFHLY